MTRRSRIAAYGSAVVLIVVGGVCAALVSGTVGQVLALVLIGLGLVLVVSLVFLEVGLSEDRAREREQGDKRGPGRRLRPRRRERGLDRRRGQRRGL
jgi:hypothetical protein